MHEQRVLFLLRSLAVGGAERQSVVLMRGLKARGVDIAVATFYGQGSLLDELRSAGVLHYCLDKRGRWDILGFMFRLLKVLRQYRPTVLYSFLTTANLVAAVVSLLMPSVCVVWGVRASRIDSRIYGRLVMLEERAIKWLSWRPDAIIFNSDAGRHYYDQMGAFCRNTHVICNGIDVERFKFSSDCRSVFRGELGIAPHATVIGLVARVDPVKGHGDFLRMAWILSRRRPDVQFLCVGSASTAYEEHLRCLPETVALGKQLIWIDEQADPCPALSSIDILVSTSRSEAFSNVIAEAMACERLCVVTNVGDSARIVGECGIVVPPNSPESAAVACERLLDLTAPEKQSLGAESRRRIIRSFGVERFVDETLDVLTRGC